MPNLCPLSVGARQRTPPSLPRTKRPGRRLCSPSAASRPADDRRPSRRAPSKAARLRVSGGDSRRVQSADAGASCFERGQLMFNNCALPSGAVRFFLMFASAFAPLGVPRWKAVRHSDDRANPGRVHWLRLAGRWDTKIRWKILPHHRWGIGSWRYRSFQIDGLWCCLWPCEAFGFPWGLRSGAARLGYC